MTLAPGDIWYWQGRTGFLCKEWYLIQETDGDIPWGTCFKSQSGREGERFRLMSGRHVMVGDVPDEVWAALAKWRLMQ